MKIEIKFSLGENEVTNSFEIADNIPTEVALRGLEVMTEEMVEQMRLEIRGILTNRFRE